MQVAVLTFHFPRNYGAVWQSWATCQLLRDLGAEPHIIDYVPDAQRLYYKQLTRRSPASFLRLVKQHAFNRFRNTSLPVLRNVLSDSVDTLPSLLSRFDAIVCGSDEIWSTHQPGGLDTTYMLAHLPAGYAGRGIAFAPSAGQTTHYEPDLRDTVAGLLSSFSAISVRDTNTQQLVADSTGISPQLVTDPTLTADMRRLLPNATGRYYKRPYVLVFSGNKAAMRLASAVAKHLRIELRALQHYCPKANRNHIFAHPQKALDLIANATSVITSYFHGTALSLAFDRSFVAVNNGDRTQKLGDLLTRSGHSDRFLAEDQCTDEAILLATTPLTPRSKQAIEAMALASRKFLSDAIETNAREST